MDKSTQHDAIGRRSFLAQTAAAGVTVVSSQVALGSRANSAVRLGMIGCGGRGTWIANLFARTGQYQFTACADYFPDRAEAFGEKFKVPATGGSRRSPPTSDCSRPPWTRW